MTPLRRRPISGRLARLCTPLWKGAGRSTGSAARPRSRPAWPPRMRRALPRPAHLARSSTCCSAVIPASRPDVTTATRLLSQAATAARTGARPVIVDSAVANLGASADAAIGSATADTDVSQAGGGLAAGPVGRHCVRPQEDQPATARSARRPARSARRSWLPRSLPTCRCPIDGAGRRARPGCTRRRGCRSSRETGTGPGSDREPVLWEPPKSPSGGTQGSWPGRGLAALPRSGPSSSGGPGPSGPGGPCWPRRAPVRARPGPAAAGCDSGTAAGRPNLPQVAGG